MSSVSAAQVAWEAATAPYPLRHKQSYGEIVEEPFRRFGDAIAWLEWTDVCEIKKLETLKPNSGAATRLLAFLKQLADEHGINLFGNPVAYDPTCSLAAASPLSQDELNSWYSRHGFLVGKSNAGVPFLCYPNNLHIMTGAA